MTRTRRARPGNGILGPRTLRAEQAERRRVQGVPTGDVPAGMVNMPTEAEVIRDLDLRLWPTVTPDEHFEFRYRTRGRGRFFSR